MVDGGNRGVGLLGTNNSAVHVTVLVLICEWCLWALVMVLSIEWVPSGFCDCDGGRVDAHGESRVGIHEM